LILIELEKTKNRLMDEMYEEKEEINNFVVIDYNNNNLNDVGDLEALLYAYPALLDIEEI
jgi:hypothetical protein